MRPRPGGQGPGSSLSHGDSVLPLASCPLARARAATTPELGQGQGSPAGPGPAVGIMIVSDSPPPGSGPGSLLRARLRRAGSDSLNGSRRQKRRFNVGLLCSNDRFRAALLLAQQLEE